MPIPACPPEWEETLSRFLGPQLKEFGITVREAAKLVGITDEPTHMQLQQINNLLTALGWSPRKLRKPGGGWLRTYFRKASSE